MYACVHAYMHANVNFTCACLSMLYVFVSLPLLAYACVTLSCRIVNYNNDYIYTISRIIRRLIMFA